MASASARLIKHHRYDLDLLPEEQQHLFDELKNPKYKVIHSSLCLNDSFLGGH